jgi:hypothetical protein
MGKAPGLAIVRNEGQAFADGLQGTFVAGNGLTMPVLASSSVQHEIGKFFT